MSVGGQRTTAIVGCLALVGLLGLAGPAAADAGSYGCTVLVGTQLASPEGPIAVSASSPAGGVGECELHTLEERSRITSLDAEEGCHVHADTDSDLFVDEPVTAGEVYDPGDAFIAFCEAGVVMADNAVALEPI